jgi:hypothetical protein
MMTSADDDAIVVAFEGVHVSLSRFAVLRLRAAFPAVGRIGKVPDTLRKGERMDSAGRSASTTSRAGGERAGKIFIAQRGDS